MKKKLLVLLLTFAMVFTMTATSFAESDFWEKNAGHQYLAIGDSIGAGYMSDGNGMNGLWSSDTWKSLEFDAKTGLKNAVDVITAYPYMVKKDTKASTKSYNATYGGMRAEDMYYLLDGMNGTTEGQYQTETFYKILNKSKWYQEDSANSLYNTDNDMTDFFRMGLSYMVPKQAISNLANDKNKANLKNAVKTSDMISVQLGLNDFTNLLVENGNKENDSLFEAYERMGEGFMNLVTVMGKFVYDLREDGDLPNALQEAILNLEDATDVDFSNIGPYLGLYTDYYYDYPTYGVSDDAKLQNIDLMKMTISEMENVYRINDDGELVYLANEQEAIGLKAIVAIGLGSVVAGDFAEAGINTAGAATRLAALILDQYGIEAAQAYAQIKTGMKEIDTITQAAVDNANTYYNKLMRLIRTQNPNAKIVATTLYNPIPENEIDWAYMFDLNKPEIDAPIFIKVLYNIFNNDKTQAEMMNIAQNVIAYSLQPYIDQVNQNILDNAETYNYGVADIRDTVTPDTDIYEYWFHPSVQGQAGIANAIMDTFEEEMYIEPLPPISEDAVCAHENLEADPTDPSVEPTYLSEGYTGGMICKDCGEKIKGEAIPKLAVPAAKLSKVVAGDNSFTAKWKKVTGITAYQVQYSSVSTFQSKTTVTVKGSSTVSKKIKNLRNKKKYYVRIRTYKTVEGTNITSPWSAAKTVKTK